MYDALGMMIMRGTLNEVSSESDEVREAMARLLLEQAGVGGKLPGNNDTVISAVDPSYQAMRLGGERPMSERVLASDEIVNQALELYNLLMLSMNLQAAEGGDQEPSRLPGQPLGWNRWVRPDVKGNGKGQSQQSDAAQQGKGKGYPRAVEESANGTGYPRAVEESGSSAARVVMVCGSSVGECLVRCYSDPRKSKQHTPYPNYCSVVGVYFQPSSFSSITKEARSAATRQDQRLRPAWGKVD